MHRVRLPAPGAVDDTSAALPEVRQRLVRDVVWRRQRQRPVSRSVAAEFQLARREFERGATTSAPRKVSVSSDWSTTCVKSTASSRQTKPDSRAFDEAGEGARTLDPQLG